MNIRTAGRSSIGWLAALAMIGMLASAAHAGDPVQVLFSFDEDEGSYPDTDLAIDGAGNLYGTTVTGGAFNGGTVFQLSPVGGSWVHTVLYNFTGGPDGGQPYGGVTLDEQGNLYGTAVIGGGGGPCVEDGCGVVYKLAHVGGSWTQSVIHDFTGGTDGYGPGGPVVFDSRGRLYGVTPTGGEFGIGVLFQLTPHSGGQWTEALIHTFTGGEDGGAGFAGRLTFDAAENLYGVSTVGGAFGAGTVYRLTPSPGGSWTLDTLYAFQGQPDGVFPYGGVVLDAAGNLYGTTYYGGTKDIGVVYRLANTGGTWTETVLHSFKGQRDGASSISGLVFDAAGNLYGTSSEGGLGCNCGTVFKLTHNPDGSWTERVSYRFQGTPDGSYPYAGLVLDSAGILYGATVRGGVDDDGTVFSFTP